MRVLSLLARDFLRIRESVPASRLRSASSAPSGSRHSADRPATSDPPSTSSSGTVPQFDDRLTRIVGRVPAQRADRAAVRDDQHVRRPGGRAAIRQRRADAARVSCSRVSPSWPISPAEPAGIALREPLLDLGAREARPRADVDLAERRIFDDLEAEPVADDARRLARTDEIARVDGVDPVAGEPSGELGGLALGRSR